MAEIERILNLPPGFGLRRPPPLSSLRCHSKAAEDAAVQDAAAPAPAFSAHSAQKETADDVFETAMDR
jgi:hypothetical protein